MHTKTDTTKLSTTNMTAEEAKRLLGQNVGNRSVRSSHVRVLSDAMRRGEWMQNGETIKVSKTGRLLDGQHRLMAIVMSGVSVPMTVIYGIDDEAFSTIDIGAKRSIGDALGMDGEENGPKLAAMLKMAYTYNETGRPYGLASYRSPTFPQLQALCTDSARNSAKFAAGKKLLRSIVGETLTAWCFMRFSTEVGVDAAQEFFDLLTSGAGLTDGSPILALRNRLMSEKVKDKTSLDKEYKAALVFKAFKLFVAGQKCKALRVRTGGESEEKGLFDLRQQDGA